MGSYVEGGTGAGANVKPLQSAALWAWVAGDAGEALSCLSLWGQNEGTRRRYVLP